MPFLVGLTFVLSLAIVLGSYWAFVVRAEETATRAIRKRLEGRPVPRRMRAQLTKKEAPLSAVKAVDALLAHSGSLLNPLKRTLAHSAMAITPGVVILSGAFAAATVFFVVMKVTAGLWISAAAAVVAMPLPYAYVRRRATLRLRKLEEQLPQAVEMIAVALRAGHALPTGVLMTAEELPEPMASEFRLVYDQQNYGKPMPDVLKEFAERVPLLDARILVTAVLTQRETGGNLAEILDRLASVIRERFRVRRQVRAMSAHGRITGWVLGLLPVVLALILSVVAPSHMATLFGDPLGRQLIVGAVILQTIGALAIRRIVNIEF